jgi:rod shape-determining protein MreD
MAEVLLLILAPIAAALLQAGLLPEYVPMGWRPDLGLLIAIGGLVYLDRSRALTLLFVLGMTADALGSARFGLMTLSYLFVAGALLSFERDWSRRGAWGAWLAMGLGTLLGHGAYVVLAQFYGMGDGLLAGWLNACQRSLSGILVGWIPAWGMREVLRWGNLLSVETQEAEKIALRNSGARKKLSFAGK